MYLFIWTDDSSIMITETVTSYEIKHLIEGDLKIVAFKEGKCHELDGIYLEWKKVDKI